MQDRERILSALSHDMKNLVGAVDMNLQLIPLILHSSPGSPLGSSLAPAAASPTSAFELASRPDGAAPVGEFLERAHQAAMGIGSLVDDVVAWFRLKDGGPVVAHDPEGSMSLGRMAALVRAEFSTTVKTQGLVFHLQMEGDGAAVLPADGAPWRVLRLVLQHCLRFLFPHQTLNVKISAQEKGSFEFSVSTDQEAVFDGQARSLAFLLAQDFASTSRGRLTSTGETVTINWCDDSHAFSTPANHSVLQSSD